MADSNYCPKCGSRWETHDADGACGEEEASRADAKQPLHLRVDMRLTLSPEARCYDESPAFTAELIKELIEARVAQVDSISIEAEGT